MFNFFAVGMGGFIGASLRYFMSSLPVFTQINFPAATLLINFLGAFIIGLVAVSAIHFEGLHPAVVLFFKTGLCGGFTTFSTFSLETMELVAKGRIFTAAVYSMASVALCLCAIYLGKMVFTALFS